MTKMCGLSCTLGVIAFALFYLYDWSTVKRPSSAFTKWGFYAGFLLVMVSMICAVYPFEPIDVTPGRLAAAIFFLVLGFAGLIKVLFFCLPKGTYADPSRKRRVYDGSFYGLCRHPGYWPYLIVFIGWTLLFGRKVLLSSILLCIWNFVYIVLQDLWTFRKIFEDYDEYRTRVPFLVPTFSSLTLWIRRSGKE